MSKRRTKADQERKRLVAEGYSECAGCKKMLKPGTRRCPECGALTPSVKRALTAFAVVALIVVAATAVYIFYPREEAYLPPPTIVSASPVGYSASTASIITVSFNRAMDKASVESSFSMAPSVQGTFSWAGYTMTFNPTQDFSDDAYYAVTIGSTARDATGEPLDCGSYSWSFSTADLPTTRRGIGTVAGDFWTAYPATHPSAGLPVSHPDWVSAALEHGVVMILAHSEGCYPCIQQTTICESVYSDRPELQYFDLSSGTDEPEASEAFAAYDPNDAAHYVPLTVIVTRALDGLGNEIVAWHSWEGVVDEVTLASWVQDAQSYYDDSA